MKRAKDQWKTACFAVFAIKVIEWNGSLILRLKTSKTFLVKETCLGFGLLFVLLNIPQEESERNLLEWKKFFDGRRFHRIHRVSLLVNGFSFQDINSDTIRRKHICKG